MNIFCVYKTLPELRRYFNKKVISMQTEKKANSEKNKNDFMVGSRRVTLSFFIVGLSCITSMLLGTIVLFVSNHNIVQHFDTIAHVNPIYWNIHIPI